jgi:DNA-directed RNA polymerase specialized sigma24 family protein
LPDDRDDIEVDIILKLKAEADKKDQVTMGFLYAVARNVVRGYWRKKYRERRRVGRLSETGKGLMVVGTGELVSCNPDIGARLDARTKLKALPKRMVKTGLRRADGERLTNADKLYLCRQRHRQSNYNWSDAAKIERMRQLYVDEGLNCTEVAKIVSKSRSSVQNHLIKLGVIRPRGIVPKIRG